MTSSIPFSVLLNTANKTPIIQSTFASPTLSPKEMTNHQNFCLAYLKAKENFDQKTCKNFLEMKKKLSRPSEKFHSQEDVFNWFMKFPLNQKVKILTVTNKFIVELLTQLYVIQRNISENQKFKPTEEYEYFYSEKTEDEIEVWCDKNNK